MKPEMQAWLSKFAGTKITLKEAADSLEHHMKSERKLFTDACEQMKAVIAMCEERKNAEDATPEQRAQYKALCDCAEKCCGVMSKHLESYK